MITSLTLGENGRLGNQLFQYAALRSLGLKNNYKVKIPSPTQKTWHSQECLLDNFHIPVDHLTDADLDSLLYTYREPDYMRYDSEFFNLSDNLNIWGYFQSILYFKEFEDQIKYELSPTDALIEDATQYIGNLREDTKKKIVSIHLRRGDNTNQTNPSRLLNDMYCEGGFYFSYLKEALKVFSNEEVTYLVFSGGSRTNSNEEDLQWCKDNLGIEALYSEESSTMQDFSRIMVCDYNILSHVSSFGWWAAYLNSEKKRVVAPLHYHPDLPEYTHRDGFYPPNFILV